MSQRVVADMRYAWPFQRLGSKIIVQQAPKNADITAVYG